MQPIGTPNSEEMPESSNKVPQVALLPELETVDLVGGRISDQFLIELARLPRLTALSVMGCRGSIGDAAFEALLTSLSLRRFTAENTLRSYSRAIEERMRSRGLL
jgi:hypothetical protein